MSGHIPWEKVTPALVEKWGGQAPRYTSYPTALEWGKDFGPDQFDAALHADGQQQQDAEQFVDRRGNAQVRPGQAGEYSQREEPDDGIHA